MNWKLILMILLIVLVVAAVSYGIYYGVRKWQDSKVEDKAKAVELYADRAYNFAITQGRDTWNNWEGRTTALRNQANQLRNDWAQDREISYDTKAAIRNLMADAKTAVNWSRDPDVNDPNYNQAIQDEWNRFISETDSFYDEVAAY